MRPFSTHRNNDRKIARKTSSFPCGCLLFVKSFSTVRRNPLLLLGVFKASASAFSSDCSSFPQSKLCGSPILRRRKRFYKIYLPFSQSATVSIVYRHAESRRNRLLFALVVPNGIADGNALVCGFVKDFCTVEVTILSVNCIIFGVFRGDGLAANHALVIQNIHAVSVTFSQDTCVKVADAD